jgi:hypothetical protein
MSAQQEANGRHIATTWAHWVTIFEAATRGLSNETITMTTEAEDKAVTRT